MDAFEDFAREVAPSLLRLGLAITGSTSQAEDLAQETLASVAKRWSHIDPVGRNQYTRRVLINRSLSDRRRTMPPQVPLEDAAASMMSTDDAQPEERFLQVERARDVRDAVRRLPNRQRLVVILRFFEDLSTAEVASLLKIREGSVRSALARAQASLLRDLNPPVPTGRTCNVTTE